MGYVIVKKMLEENNGDYFAVARKLGKLYNRGIITKDEYEEEMDILASIMLFEK